MSRINPLLSVLVILRQLAQLEQVVASPFFYPVHVIRQQAIPFPLTTPALTLPTLPPILLLLLYITLPHVPIMARLFNLTVLVGPSPPLLLLPNLT